MPIPHRKNSFCLNCNRQLNEKDNFCSECGQENNDKVVRFSELVKEVFGNIFAYDSQFIRSIIPFLFKPGYLTNHFLAGKRRRYIQPIKLYFATSFLFFLFYSNQFNINEKDLNRDVNFDKINIDKKDSLEVKNVLGSIDSLKYLGLDSTTINDYIYKDKIKSLAKTNSNKKNKSLFDQIFSDKTQKLIKDKKLNPENLLDSLKLEKGFFNILLAKQSIKVANEGGTKEFFNYAISKLPLMMFIVMPIVALILKLLYAGILSRIIYQLKKVFKWFFHIGKKTIYKAVQTSRINLNIIDPKGFLNEKFTYPRRYYIEHLTFTLHLHSFLFFCFVLINISLKIELNILRYILIWILGIWMVIYTWKSFKKVYKESSLKTSIKIYLLLNAYIISMAICFIFLLIISLLLF